MEAMFWRFPHIGEQIVGLLEDRSLAKCRDIGRSWMEFVDDQRFYQDKIKQIIDEKAKLFYRGRNRGRSERSLMHDAAIAGQTQIFINAFEEDIDRNSKFISGNTPLHDAAENGHLGIFIHIISEIPRLQRKHPINGSGDTPLHKAAIEGHYDIFQMTLPNILDKNPRNYGGFTPLHIAAEHGHSEICQYIISWVGDSVDEEMPKSDCLMTPLHLAASNGHISVCLSLIALYKDINNLFKVENHKDAYGDTPLHKAALNGHLEVFFTVTSRIQNINPRNDRGFTPLHFAARYGYLNVCEYIIDRVPDKNPTNDNLWTPLHDAASHGCTAVCQLIIKNNQRDIHPEDKFGRTPLFLARKNGYSQTARVLSSWKPKHRGINKHKINKNNYKM